MVYRVFHKILYQTPSPQRKKEPPVKENKLRYFLKRSSEPLLNLQNAAQQVNFLYSFIVTLLKYLEKKKIFFFNII